MPSSVTFTEKHTGRSWAFGEAARSEVRVYSKVGFPVESPETSFRDEDSDLSVVEIAVVNEFGSSNGHIPSRPFLRTAYDNNLDKIARMSRILAGKAMDEIAHGADPAPVFKQKIGLMGEWFTGVVKLSIRNWKIPANALSTQILKGKKKASVADLITFIDIDKKQIKNRKRKQLLINNPLVDTGRMMQSVTHVEID